MEVTIGMAKATKEDLEAAMDVVGALESISNWGVMPGEIADADCEAFDAENADQCRRLFDHLVSLTRRGSLFRVVYGMACLLDPVNEIIDPESDTLKVHPSLMRKTEAAPGPETKADPEVDP